MRRGRSTPPTRLVRSSRLARLALVAALASGCGYKSGLTLGPTRRTVGIEIFANDSRSHLVPDLERDLHEALTESVLSLVHAPLVAPGEAELVVRGRIRDYRRRPGIRDAENQLLETGIRIEIDAELLERRPDGSEVSLGETNANSRSGYVLSDPRGEVEARDRILGILAERVVLDLFTPLSYER